jgi:hypothetical protein
VAAARAARPTDAPRAPDEGCNQKSSSEVIMRASRAHDEGGNQRCNEGSSVVLSGHQPARCAARLLRDHLLAGEHVTSQRDQGAIKGPSRRDHLLAHAAHREHVASQRDLARHRGIRACQPACEERCERHKHSCSGGGAVLPDCARGEVHLMREAISRPLACKQPLAIRLAIRGHQWPTVAISGRQ